MKSPLNETLTVMGVVFLITLILNSFTSIDFYNQNGTIAFLAFALAYFCVKKFRGNKGSSH